MYTVTPFRNMRSVLEKPKAITKKYITQGCFYGAEEEELYEGIQLYPLKDTGYAYPQWMERYFSGERDKYQLLVLKSSEKLEVVYQFLNALASDVELAGKVQEGLKDEGGLPLCHLSPYAGAKDNGGRHVFYRRAIGREYKETEGEL